MTGNDTNTKGTTMTAMTEAKTYHLKFWARADGYTSNPLIPALDVQRIYVNAEDGSSAGYIELRIVNKERVRGDYYGDHRAAKGDTTEESGRFISVKLEDGIEAAIRQAIGCDGDNEGLFSEMKKRARGVNWVCGAAQKKQLRQLAKFTFQA